MMSINVRDLAHPTNYIQVLLAGFHDAYPDLARNSGDSVLFTVDEFADVLLNPSPKTESCCASSPPEFVPCG